MVRLVVEHVLNDPPNCDLVSGRHLNDSIGIGDCFKYLQRSPPDPICYFEIPSDRLVWGNRPNLPIDVEFAFEPIHFGEV